MTITAIGSIAIRSMRDTCGDGFAAWDECVNRNDRTGARAARRKIQAAALAFLPKPVADLPGWYVFADLGQNAGVKGIHYVGIAKTPRRPTGRRIVDRFKDDSCLDVALDDLPHLEQRRIVERRLLTALPHSGGNYVDKHIAVANLIRRSTHILLVGTLDGVQLIEEVERLLIGAAVKAGASLTNIQHLSSRRTASAAGARRALEVLDHLRLLGVPQSTIECWGLPLMVA